MAYSKQDMTGILFGLNEESTQEKLDEALRNCRIVCDKNEYSDQEMALVRKYLELTANEQAKAEFLADIVDTKVFEDDEQSLAYVELSLNQLLTKFGQGKEVQDNKQESANKYTLKSIKAEIEENLERSVKLSELEIILELSHLTLEDEYTDTQKQAIDKGLIKYLNQKSNGSFSSSDDEALLTVIRTNSGKTVESLVDRVSIKTAETEDYLNEMVDRQIPQEIFLQLKNQQESGIIAQKIEIAREKIAQQKRLNGKPTTIEIALTTDEQKHLPPMKSASVEDSKENGEK
ncbi:hypothetical protein C7H19_15190 [Aphanothece hegewaldii CCALA 016]|uniref:Uncharacterized protein n=1 Tax=Aphanothece hegewaldii CCALA 016 TaxID=2107694 RepID=A0A2T1LVK8_9CHRO|nr:hypothetical protein [Aphanothece hegewaldii]PSF35768.1 hypothetical protein C7H19_15190 [Aphanothece hegewaldii CCALA 016]